jgi:acetolactate synthase-1/2/3 large subunit
MELMEPFGCIRRGSTQVEFSGTNLHNPDFAAVAEAFGMKGFCVRQTEDFAEAFEQASESKTGALLELIVSVEAITPRKTIADLRSGG